MAFLASTVIIIKNIVEVLKMTNDWLNTEKNEWFRTLELALKPRETFSIILFI
jgi:hypothetical protein